MDNAASDDEVSDAGNDHTRMLLAIWILLFCFFLSLPFCSNAKRRQLWRQRVRERRWVMDDDEDDWYRQLVERRRSERRQELEAEQLRFQTTKTQEDDIREQYLLLLLEKHSLVSSILDLHVSIFVGTFTDTSNTFVICFSCLRLSQLQIFTN
jgi:hypothetical protein